MITVEFIDNSKFKIGSRGHEVICDQPIPVGDNAGMGPVELFLGALGSCAGFYAKEFLVRRNLPTNGLKINVSAERSGDAPPRFKRIIINLDIPADVPEKYHQAIQRAAATCFLFRSMPEPVEMETNIRVAAPIN